MAPDGAIAQCAAAGLVALAGVHELHVVDVAVRLVEVAVAVVIIAVPDVEAAQVFIDLSWGLASRDLSGVPAIDGIDQEIPDGISTPGPGSPSS